MEVKIETSWKKLLEDEFGKDYFEELVEFVKMSIKTQLFIHRLGLFLMLLN